MARSLINRVLFVVVGSLLLAASVGAQGVPTLDSYDGVEVRVLQSNNAGNIHHVIDPDNEYPRNYTGYLRVTLKNDDIKEASQPYLRGGRHEPLADEEISAKFAANMLFGDVNEQAIPGLEVICRTLFEQPDVTGIRAFMEI